MIQKERKEEKQKSLVGTEMYNVVRYSSCEQILRMPYIIIVIHSL